jgi:hypothetical protein
LDDDQGSRGQGFKDSGQVLNITKRIPLTERLPSPFFEGIYLLRIYIPQPFSILQKFSDKIWMELYGDLGYICQAAE